MTISKGFLGERFVIQRARLISGILLWILCSYILYAFFYCFRETFRILTVDLGKQPLLVLNIKVTFLYNLFYSALATSLGYMFALRFILSYSITGQTARQRLLVRHTLNDADFFSWSFLFWFGKFLSTLGILYISFPLQYDIAFLKEFPLLLILIPLVVFFSTWPRLIRVVGNDKYKWLGISTGLFLMLSFGFALKNFNVFQRINHNMLKRNVNYSYTLDVPKSQSFQVIEAKNPGIFYSPDNRFNVIDIYVVMDTINTSQPLIFFEDIYNEIELGQISEILKIERGRLEDEPGGRVAVNLHMDKEVQLDFLNQLNYQIRKAGQRLILYSTVPKYSRYPANYPAFRYSGLRYTLQKYYPEFEAFLDSAEKVDLSKYSFRIPDSQMIG